MKNPLRSCTWVALCFLILGHLSEAQVPQLINYQGRVTVGTVNFDGPGQFKFALVNGDGTTTYWSNDGTSAAGSQPAAAVALTVTKGLYSALLGDATLPNMSVVPATVFANVDVRLRVWFNDGANGSQVLTPDQRIAAVGYAMMAGTVQDGAITSGKLAPGAVGSEQLATGAAAANLNAVGQSGVASGSVVLSLTDNNAALVSAGYVRIGATTTSDAWQQRPQTPASIARSHHTAVWTGSEMIIWGGQYGDYLNDGWRFNPAGNVWTAVATTDEPAARFEHTAVWTGSEMIIWGGRDSSQRFNDGSRYNPITNSWTALTATGAPSARESHTAVWTGSEMIVWGGGGFGIFSFLNNGGRYNPTGNTWEPVSTTGAASARQRHTAVWTGSEMIVWGGEGFDYRNDGGRYNPAADSWTAVTTSGAPGGRFLHTAIWTGSEMVLWGGEGGAGLLNDGGRYHPLLDSWAAVTLTGAPGARNAHTTVWTGTEMIVWGGQGGSGFTSLNDGARYNPQANSWRAMSTVAAPAARFAHTVVWTGTEMIIWGGQGAEYFNDPIGYTPDQVMVLYQRP